MERRGLRLLRGVRADLTVQVYAAGEAGAPDSGTVVVTDEAGETVASGNIETDGTLATFALTSAQTAEVAQLTATWTLTVSGIADQVVTTYHQVVGDLLITPSAARAYDNGAMADTDDYDEAAILEGRDRVHDEFEGIIGCALGTSYARETLDGTGTDTLWLPHVQVTRVRSVETRSNGTWTAFDNDDLANVLTFTNGTLIPDGAIWPAGKRNVRVAYEHGLQPVPLDLRGVALRRLRDVLVPSNIPDRATQQFDDLGTFQLSTANADRHVWFGLPSVDATLNRYRDKYHIPTVV